MKKFISILFLLIGFSLQAQVFNDFFIGKSLSIGRGGNYAPSNALLVIGDDNATKAMIIPRVSNRSIIAFPAYGMIVYDKSTGSIWYRDQVDWKELGASSVDWKVSGNAATTSSHFIGTLDDNPLRFRINNQERMVLTSSGLGINVSNPSSALDVDGIFKLRGGVALMKIATAEDRSIIDANTDVEFQTHAHTRLRITANGKVGIGNVIPESLLDVDGIIQSRGSFLLHHPATTLRAEWGQSGNVAMLRTISDNPISFGTFSTERMRLTNAGLGIGTTSPPYPLTVINPGSQIHFSDNTQDKGGYLFTRGFINTTVVLAQDVSLEGGQYIAKGYNAGLLTLSGGTFQFFGGVNENPGSPFTALQRIKVDATTGNFMIGIGSASSQRKLQVNGDAAITGSSGTANTLMGRNSTGDIAAVSVSQAFSLANNILSTSNGSYGLPSVLQTTNNTIVTAHTITIEDNSAGKLTVMFTGFDKINNQYVFLKRSVNYKKIGGTLTLGTIRSLETDEIDGLTTASVTIDANAGNIRCRVTGESGKTINWSLYINSEKNIPPN